MKRVIYYLITIFLLVHTSCERDNVVDNVVGKAEGEDINLSFMLSDYSKEDLSSQSRTTESNATGAEKKVNNIWVIQFKNHTTLGERTLIGTPRYVSGNIKPNLNISGGSNNYIFLASLKTGEDQILYLVANTDDGALYNTTNITTESTFLSKLIPAATARNNGHLVMVGKLEGNINSVNELGQIILASAPQEVKVVSLHRRLAKVEFKYTIESTLGNTNNLTGNKAHFSVSSITLNNAPKNATAQPSATTDALLTSGTSSTLHNSKVEVLTTTTTFTTEANAYTGSFTFYVPEIIGGIETEEPNEHESWKIGDFDNKNGWPDYSKLLSHIEIKGVYTTFHMNALGTTYEKVAENVSYKIYLGEDMLNNYNVMANTHYKVTCNINTIFKGDRRITITTPPTL